MTATRRCVGVTTFSQRVFHDLQIQCLIGAETLELAIFFYERFQPLRIAALQPAVFFLPSIQRLLGDAVAANQIGDFATGIPLVQDLHDLLFGESTLTHRPLGSRTNNLPGPVNGLHVTFSVATLQLPKRPIVKNFCLRIVHCCRNRRRAS